MPTSDSSGMRLSPAHFAYLRAVTEGIARDDAARRYLGLDHGHQLRRLHDQAIAYLRAVARRAGDSRWRLVGVDVGAVTRSANPGAATRPTMAEWVAAQGYEDWSEAEQLAMYAEAFPPSLSGPEATLQRRSQRAARLRRRQLDLLADLEASAAVAPRETDPVDAWFDPQASERLQRAGFSMLGELARAVRQGGRWWRGMPGIGPTKAARMQAYLDRLLPASSQPSHRVALRVSGATVGPPTAGAIAHTRLSLALDGSSGSNRAQVPPTIEASTDLEAIRAWVEARAGSPRTAASYEREALRWMLWCALERGKAMSSAGPDDCRAYMDFLREVPDHWIQAGQRQRLGEGWAPFRGQLGLAGRRHAVKVLHLMCGWLVDHARWLRSNPWGAVQRRLVDGHDQAPAPASRALTPAAYDALLRHAQREATQADRYPAAARNLFLLVWIRHTGLRASEVLAGRRSDMRRTRAGWLIGVVGKGRKARDVSVPSPAVAALQAYLRHRGIADLDSCPCETPLLGSAEGETSTSGSAVHKSFTRFVQRALRAAQLPPDERAQAARATQHWLRHTYATRWAEAGGPQDVLMAEMGHSSPTTTAGYYTAQLERRQAAVEKISAGIQPE
jgi:integrase